MTTELEPLVMCSECGGEQYILIGCCSGKDCGCQGKPTAFANCRKCNPTGFGPMGKRILEMEDHLEYIGT